MAVKYQRYFGPFQNQKIISVDQQIPITTNNFAHNLSLRKHYFELMNYVKKRPFNFRVLTTVYCGRDVCCRCR